MIVRIRSYAWMLVLFVAASVRGQEMAPITGWQDHYAYRQARSVVRGGGLVYCATSNAVFSYSPSTGEIERITKINGLSDVGINGLAWSEARSALLVYYTNGNLDLLYPGGANYNMADIKRASIMGSKTVNVAHMEGNTAYLGCGFGVVVLDLVAREVVDTWFIGPAGAQVNVAGIIFHGDSIHLATSEGLLSAFRFASNLASFTNWHKRTDLPAGVVNGPFSAATILGDRLAVNFSGGGANDTLYVLQGTEWQPIEPLFGRTCRSLTTSENGQFMVATHNDGVRTFDQSLAVVGEQHGYAGTWVDAAMAVYKEGGEVWVADRRIGLVQGTGGWNGTAYRPPGPMNSNVIRLSVQSSTLFASTGAISSTWANQYLKEGVHHYANGVWGTNSIDNTPIMFGDNEFGGAANDIIVVAVDPNDPARAFAGSWDDGVLEFRDRVPVKWYNSTNSSLQVEIGSSMGKVNVGGLAFDRNGDLWVTNAHAPAPISVFTRDGTWKSFSPGPILNSNLLVADLVAATNGQKWIVRPRGNGLLVFDDGGTIQDTGDDRYKVLNNAEGSGGLPTLDVRSVAEDLNGQIWVGTGQGPAIFYDPAGIFGDNAQDAQQILIEQDGNVQILLATEVVTAIAIDGANRKWIGTETSGAFLLSADGRTQEHHFNMENSPLPSNQINSIAVDGITGEVFFGTNQGIISYRSDATDGVFPVECAKVFPNPVRETYTGPIAITGLLRDSEVKITDVAGNLVYRTSSMGGQAIWPGTDMTGNRVATGVYLVLASDRFGNSKCNTKVLVVR